MNTITGFAVYYNSDGTEGKGPMVFTGLLFSKKSDAIQFVKSKDYAMKWGVMGTPGSEWDVRPMEIFSFENYGEFKDNWDYTQKASIAARAKNKLSDEELEALGLER